MSFVTMGGMSVCVFCDHGGYVGVCVCCVTMGDMSVCVFCDHGGYVSVCLL